MTRRNPERRPLRRRRRRHRRRLRARGADRADRRGDQRAGCMGGLGGVRRPVRPRPAASRTRSWSRPPTGSAPRCCSPPSRRSRAVGVDLVAMCVNDLVVQGAQPVLPRLLRDRVAGAGLRRRGGGRDRRRLPARRVRADRRRDRRDAGRLRPGRVRSRGLRCGGGRARGHPAATGPDRRRRRRAGRPPRASTPTASPWSASSYASTAWVLKTLPVRSRPSARRRAAGADADLRGRLPRRDRGRGVKALAHVGGGLVENPPRVLGEGQVMQIDAASWTPPPVFRWLAEAGGLDALELLRTFNCGIGMVLVVDPGRADAVRRALAASGEGAHGRHHRSRLRPAAGGVRAA